MTTVHFLGEDCTLEWGLYARPRNRRLQLWASDGPMATASLNPATPLPDGFIAIKDYRENAGILAALVAVGVVEDTGDLVPVGYELANLCVILACEQGKRRAYGFGCTSLSFFFVTTK